MNKIVICIGTYKRPEMLKKLILSIFNCESKESLIKDVKLIIVDNDALKTAEGVIDELILLSENKYKLQYFNYPIKGLASVRNELLRKAKLLEPDFLIFIDDDEYVSKNWLNELVSSIIDNNADAARGPVHAIINHKVPKDISIWFKRENFLNGTQIYSLTTGNLILKYKTLSEHNLWFNEQFNHSGSEDGYFGIELMKKGGSIFWAGKAVAYEQIPSGRTTLNWLIKRRYRVASTFTFILKLEKQYYKLMRKLIISIFYLFSGAICIVILFPFTNRYWGILKVSEGLGGLAGSLNFKYNEYK